MAEKEKTEAIELTEVVTGTAPAFKLADGTVTDANGLLVWMANQLLQIKKVVG